VSDAAYAVPNYAAFLSYSHADGEFGDWLHKRLESYEVPLPLAGARRPAGISGKRLGKVFRDRADLSAAHDLGGEIRRALQQSGALIVICSPRSAASRYVNEEIRYFKELGGGARIFAAIIGGEPYAAGKPGGSAADECFPGSLIYRLDAEGAIGPTPEASEPIAADFRPGRDGLENGALKLIAGLLGVGLDELVQRERQAERARRQRAYKIAGAMAGLALAVVVAGGAALWQWSLAREALERVFAERSWEALRRGDHSLAARYALAGWRAAPGNTPVHRAALGAALHGGGLPLPLRGHEKSVVLSASFSPDGTRIVTAAKDGTAGIWDADTGRDVAALHGHGGEVDYARFSPAGTRIVTVSKDRTARLWDAATGRDIAALQEQKDGIWHAVFNAAGTRVLTISEKGKARLWDAASGKEVVAAPGTDDVREGPFTADAGRIIAFSPERTRVIAPSGETARIWDIPNRREIAVLSGHRGGALRAMFSPDGARVVTVSPLGTARVWDAADGRPIVDLREEDSCAYWAPRICASRVEPPRQKECVAEFLSNLESETRLGECSPGYNGIVSALFSPDGTRILTLSEHEAAARVWDAATGQSIAAIPRYHQSGIARASFSPDGRRILTSAKYDPTVRMWDAATGRLVTKLRGRPALSGAPLAVFSPDGSRIVTATDDRALRVWDTADGKEVAVLRGHQIDVRDAEFSPDGARLVTVGEDARVWTIVNEQANVKVVGERAAATLSPDGKRFVTAVKRGTARLREAVGGREIAVLRGHADDMTLVSFSRDGTRLVTVGARGTARVWDAGDGREIAALHGLRAEPLWNPQRITPNAVLSPDGKRVLAAAPDDTARVWDVASGQEVAVIRGLPKGIYSFPYGAFSPDGTRIVTIADGIAARIWDAASGKELIAVDKRYSATSAVFSPDGKRILTVSTAAAHLWDAASGKEIAGLLGQKDDFGGIKWYAFSQDGARLLTMHGHFGTVRIWDPADGREIAVLSLRYGGISHAAFSRDGTRIVTVSTNPTEHDHHAARVWHADTGKEIAVMRGHERDVTSAAFGPDATRIVTASKDRTARVWDADTGREIAVLRGHEGEVTWAGFSPDGTRIVTESEDGTTRIWSVRYLMAPMEALASEACLRLSQPMDGNRVVFSRIEIAADPLIEEVWLRDWRNMITGANLFSDICDGVSMVPAMGRERRAE
jgi:WD40 repeat protein